MSTHKGAYTYKIFQPLPMGGHEKCSHGKAQVEVKMTISCMKSTIQTVGGSKRKAKCGTFVAKDILISLPFLCFSPIFISIFCLPYSHAMRINVSWLIWNVIIGHLWVCTFIWNIQYLELAAVSRSVIDSEKRKWVLNSVRAKHHVDHQTRLSVAELTWMQQMHSEQGVQLHGREKGQPTSLCDLQHKGWGCVPSEGRESSIENAKPGRLVMQP